MDWKQQLHEQAKVVNAKLRVGDIYKRVNGPGPSYGYFEIVYIAYAWVVLHSTYRDEHGERTCAPYVEVTQNFLDQGQKNPYIQVLEVEL